MRSFILIFPTVWWHCITKVVWTARRFHCLVGAFSNVCYGFLVFWCVHGARYALDNDDVVVLMLPLVLLIPIVSLTPVMHVVIRMPVRLWSSKASLTPLVQLGFIVDMVAWGIFKSWLEFSSSSLELRNWRHRSLWEKGVRAFHKPFLRWLILSWHLPCFYATRWRQWWFSTPWMLETEGVGAF